ncbi:hypothetical protein BDY21DRAFT_353127 [Lineolata rhizophorae]|uniref:Sld7 C-terminal domain-containing protein n=1 Tax=Lineolata rhizophorae TaxID=578093 RepID=A0A6A6NS04_9PEZI|nr:hypothetical protein BDY21DRAFT_353127 [Lineolata rhizophorae]
MDIWHGDICLPDGSYIRDIWLRSPADCTYAPKIKSLAFLAFVNTYDIPPATYISDRLEVTTSTPETAEYFQSNLVERCPENMDPECPWWNRRSRSSPISILTEVTLSDDACGEGEGDSGPQYVANITNVLFMAVTPEIEYNLKDLEDETSNSGAAFASSSAATGAHSSTSASDDEQLEIRIVAQPMSDDVLIAAELLKSLPVPDQPGPGQDSFGVSFCLWCLNSPRLLCPLHTSGNDDAVSTDDEEQPSSCPPQSSVFDHAAEQRRKAKRRGGLSISAAVAASSQQATGIPSLHSPSPRVTSSPGAPLHARPSSRSPSVSLPPGSAVGQSTGASASRPQTSRGPSGLTRVESVTAGEEESPATALEAKNKDAVSRVVMAGLRLYGMQPRSSRRKKSLVTGNSVNAAQEEEDRRKDEEFKLVYHQVYKGAVFAFRAYMRTIPLQQHTDHVRETVDQLLAIFCSDPMASSTKSEDAPGQERTLSVTPGGRKRLYGEDPTEVEKSPFNQKAAEEATLMAVGRKKR